MALLLSPPLGLVPRRLYNIATGLDSGARGLSRKTHETDAILRQNVYPRNIYEDGYEENKHRHKHHGSSSRKGSGTDVVRIRGRAIADDVPASAIPAPTPMDEAPPSTVDDTATTPHHTTLAEPPTFTLLSHSTNLLTSSTNFSNDGHSAIMTSHLGTTTVKPSQSFSTTTLWVYVSPSSTGSPGSSTAAATDSNATPSIHLAPHVIALIAFGGIVFLSLLSLLTLFLIRRRRRHRRLRHIAGLPIRIRIKRDGDDLSDAIGGGQKRTRINLDDDDGSPLFGGKERLSAVSYGGPGPAPINANATNGAWGGPPPPPPVSVPPQSSSVGSLLPTFVGASGLKKDREREKEKAREKRKSRQSMLLGNAGLSHGTGAGGGDGWAILASGDGEGEAVGKTRAKEKRLSQARAQGQTLLPRPPAITGLDPECSPASVYTTANTAVGCAFLGAEPLPQRHLGDTQPLRFLDKEKETSNSVRRRSLRASVLGNEYGYSGAMAAMGMAISPPTHATVLDAPTTVPGGGAAYEAPRPAPLPASGSKTKLKPSTKGSVRVKPGSGKSRVPVQTRQMQEETQQSSIRPSESRERVQAPYPYLPHVPTRISQAQASLSVGAEGNREKRASMARGGYASTARDRVDGHGAGDRDEQTFAHAIPSVKTQERRVRDTEALTSALGLSDESPGSDAGAAGAASAFLPSPVSAIYPDDSLSVALGYYGKNDTPRPNGDGRGKERGYGLGLGDNHGHGYGYDPEGTGNDMPSPMGTHAALGSLMLQDFPSSESGNTGGGSVMRKASASRAASHLTSNSAARAGGGAQGPATSNFLLTTRTADRPPRVPSPPTLPSLAAMAFAHADAHAAGEYRSPTYSIYGLYESQRKSGIGG